MSGVLGFVSKEKNMKKTSPRSSRPQLLDAATLSAVQGGHICCDPGEECGPDISPEDCMPNPAPEEEEEGTLMARLNRASTPYDHSLDR